MGNWDFGDDYSGAVVAGDLVILRGIAPSTLAPPGGAPSPFANNFILAFKRQSCSTGFGEWLSPRRARSKRMSNRGHR